MMDIRIYQVNHDRDKDNVGFMSYDTLPRFQGAQEPNPEIYDKVFEGPVDCSSLEGIYAKFNTDHPAGYCGRSLSVSDIVEVIEAPDTEAGFYFCDSFGFKSVPFDPDQAQEKSDTIKVVLLEPGKLARIADIDASLEGMQKIVADLLKEKLRLGLKCLSREDVGILFELYVIGKSVTQLSKERGVSHQAISKRVSRILSKLKNYL